MAKYREQDSFSSFQDLGKTFTRETDKQREEELRDYFDRVLAGKFVQLGRGNFQTQLPGIDSISLIPATSKDGQRHALHILPYYKNRGGKEAHVTLTLSESGQISGDALPDQLQIKPADIEREALRIIEQQHVEFWHQTDLPIIPYKDLIIPEEESEEEGGESPRYVDPERLAFYARQKNAVFGAISRREGFDGYKLIFFRGEKRDFLVLDNDKAPNAAFILDLDPGTQIQSSLEKTARERLLRSIWEPIVNQAGTKRGLKQLGATKLVHTKTWQIRMQELIDKRLAN